MDLRQEVRNKIQELGIAESKKLFGVSSGTLSNWSSGRTDPSIAAAQIILDEKIIESPPSVAEPLTQWEGKKVHLVLPVYRSFNPKTHFTLFANYAKYGPEKIGITMEERTMIHEARNVGTHKALRTDAEWIVMGDDDMVIPPGSAGIMNGNYGANLPEPSASLVGLSRLLSHPVDYKIVGSLYFGRHRFGRAQCHLGFESDHENENLRKHRHTALIPMGWVGTGFLRIHRSVFDALRKEIDAGRWPECKPVNEAMWYGYWNPSRVGVGEDVSFGRRCAEIGIVSYLDPVLECLHVGDVPFGSSNTSNKQ